MKDNDLNRIIIKGRPDAPVLFFGRGSDSSRVFPSHRPQSNNFSGILDFVALRPAVLNLNLELRPKGPLGRFAHFESWVLIW